MGDYRHSTMHCQVITTKIIIHVMKYIVVNCDEVMIVDNQCWVNIHADLVEGFNCSLILLNLERQVSGGTTNKFTNVILNSLLVYLGLIVEDIDHKLICFEFDAIVVFIGVHSVTTQIYQKAIPFMLVIHFVAHQKKPYCFNILKETIGVKN